MKVHLVILCQIESFRENCDSITSTNQIRVLISVPLSNGYGPLVVALLITYGVLNKSQDDWISEFWRLIQQLLLCTDLSWTIGGPWKSELELIGITRNESWYFTFNEHLLYFKRVEIDRLQFYIEVAWNRRLKNRSSTSSNFWHFRWKTQLSRSFRNLSWL